MSCDVRASQQSVSSRKPVRLLRRRALRVAAVAACAVVVCVAAVVIYLSQGLAAGQRFAKAGKWHDAVVATSRYLWIWPNDGRARLALAEARLRAADAARQRPEQAVAMALADLERIPDSAEEAVEARLHAANLTLLIQKRPAAAERLVRRAIAADADSLLAHVLLWQILDLTRRYEEAEPVFWEVMRLAPDRDRVLHLRRWYLSQFAPASANLELDRLLKILGPEESPSYQRELERYETFRAAEPGVPMHAAAVAMIMLRVNDAEEGMRLLREAETDKAWGDAGYVAVRAETAYHLGELDEVARCVSKWPVAKRDFRYWKWLGTVTEQTEGDIDDALKAYEKALALWPGSIDWQIEFRRAHCLRRLGRADEAKRVRAWSDALERLLTTEHHTPLRRSLADLNDANALSDIVEFYDAIDRPREADLWRKHIAGLQRPSPIRL